MKNYVKTLMMLLFVVLTANNLTADEWVSFNNNPQSQPEITVVSSDNNHTLIDCEIPGMLKDNIFANEENWDKLYFSLPTAIGYSGEPLVPRIWKKIAIPADSDVQVNILSSDFITLSDYNVYPFQQVIGDEIPTFQQDMNIYDQDEFYPENIVSISEPMIMRDYRIVQIEISPVQYNPVTHQIKAYTQIEIELVYSGYNNINILTNARNVIPERVASMYKSSILNYDSVSKDIRDDTHKRILFIGKELYTDCLPELIEWKRKKGYYVDIYDPFNVGASSAEEIKDYINNYYNSYSSTWDIYVILVGNIPYGRMLETQQYQPQQYFSSDHYYSTISGDYLPEISVGRISIRDTVYHHHATTGNYEEILHNYANKVVQYETSPYQGQEDWFNNIVFAASQIVNPGFDEAFEEAKEESDDYINPSQFTINYQYGEDGATNTSLINALDDGCIIWNFAAHGETDRWRLWSAPPIKDFSHDQVYSLQNSGIPVVYSISCHTAYIGTSNICMSEILLNHQSAGAIGFLGFTYRVLTSMAPNTDIQLIRSTFDPEYQFDQPQYIIGDIEFYMNTMLTGPVYDVEDTVIKSALVGDPTLELWTDPPQEFNVTINFDNDKVYVKDTSNNPIQGAIVTFIEPGFYRVMVTNSSGIADPNHDIMAITDINVTKHNFIPYQRTETIYENTTFSGTVNIDGILKVAEGVTLTLYDCTCNIDNISAIIVDGGNLIADNSDLNVNNGSININAGEMLVTNDSYVIIYDEMTFSGRSLLEVTNGSEFQLEPGSSLYGTDHTVYEDPATGESYDTFEEASQNIPNIGEEHAIPGDKIIIRDGGIFTASGTSTNYITIDCVGDYRWDGLELGNCYDSNHTIEYCNISRINYIIVQNTDISFRNSSFYESGFVQLNNVSGTGSGYYSRSYISSNHFYNNSGPLLIYNSACYINDNTIEYNTGGGICICYPGNERNILYDNTIYNNYGTGISLYDTPATLTFNTIWESYYSYSHGFVSYGAAGTPILAGNTIANNGGMEIVGLYQWPDLTSLVGSYGANTVYSQDNGGTDHYLLGTSVQGSDCRGNNIDLSDHTRFLPSFSYYIFDGEDSEERILYASAVEDISEEEYESAKTTMTEIVDDYPETDTAISALQWLLYLENFSGNDYAGLRAYAETIDDVSYPNLERIKNKVITSTYMCEKDYLTSIDRLEDVIADPPSVEDSILALINEGYCYLKLDEGGKAAPVKCTFKPRSFDEFKYVSQNLTKNLLDKAIPTSEPPTTDPQTIEFVLHQNYPNPASLSTTFSFSIPVNTKDAELKIYNIKGQLVKTFHQETLDKGTTSEITWDCKDKNGKTLCNGIYFYKLTVDKNEIIKKMIIMK